MRKFCFMIFLLSLISCEVKEKKESDILPEKIKFNGYTKVYFKYSNAPDTNFSVFIHAWSMFRNTESGSSLKRVDDGMLFDRIPCFYPQTMDLMIFQNGASPKSFKLTTLFLIPGDSLTIEMDLSDSANYKKSMVFYGNTASLCRYYNQKEIHFGTTDFNYAKATACNFMSGYQAYRERVDSLVAKEFEFFFDYIKSNVLPRWAITYELNNLKYTNAASLLNGTIYRQRMLFPGEELPDDCYDFLDSLKINEPDARFLSFYYMFLRDYSNSFYELPFEKRDTTLPRSESVFYRDVCFADSFLDEDIKDIYLTSQWYMWSNMRNIKDEIDPFYKYIGDSVYRNFLKEHIQSKYSLNKGMLAPDFYLKDTLGNAYSLKSFNGRLVYLFFWNSGCKPCLKVLSELNSFMDEFKNEDVVIISICTDPTEETWKYILKKYAPKSLNLWAKGNWGKLLSESYDIHAHPHFCLIDSSGHVIENKCERPGETGSKMIMSSIRQEE